MSVPTSAVRTRARHVSLFDEAPDDGSEVVGDRHIRDRGGVIRAVVPEVDQGTPTRPNSERIPRLGSVPGRSQLPALPPDRLAVQWQRALDAAQVALGSAHLPDGKVRTRALLAEREATADSLRSLAILVGSNPAPWLAPFPVAPQLLGLPRGTKACVFDLDGVLTDSAPLHAAVWADLFDDLLLGLAEQTGWQFVPFDPVDEYRRYLDGRSRLEGIARFLDSRGIRLSDEAQRALALRKGVALARLLRNRGVVALPGARRYLEAAERAGISCAVVAPSASTHRMLVLAGLAPLVEVVVDASVVEAEHLPPRPAPDILIAACRRLGVDPHEVAALSGAPAGIAAARSAGLVAVGVGGDEELLHALGAQRAVPTLGALLDPRLAAS